MSNEPIELTAFGAQRKVLSDDATSGVAPEGDLRRQLRI
jgi:hypothetical protein